MTRNRIYGAYFLLAALVVLALRAAGWGQIITTVAGGYSSDGGPATQAQLSWPTAVTVDAEGNLYIADHANYWVRRVDGETGVITTVAGTGVAGYSGDGGLATQAQLVGLENLEVDVDGNLYIVDGNTIRRVDGVTGVITTVVGTGEPGYSGDGGPATQAKLGDPYGVTVDADGNLYIADFPNHRIRRVDATFGVITTVAGSGVVDYSGYSGDGSLAINAQLNHPASVATDGAGNLYIADFSNHRIRRVDGITGVITTVAGNGERGYAGDGGPATEAQLNEPGAVAIDAEGTLFIAEKYNHRIRRVDGITGVITTVAGTGVGGYSGDGGLATKAQLDIPAGVALDGAGNLFIADSGNHRIRRVDRATGVITTVAGTGEQRYWGDGGPATEAQLNPGGVAVDADGNLYIVDGNTIRRVDGVTGVITTVAGTGDGGYSGDGGLATLAEMSPSDVTVDANGNLFIVDTNIGSIRRVDGTTGMITTVVGTGEQSGTTYSGDGGPATQAQLGFATHVAIDGDGNLFIVEHFNQSIRRVGGATDIITTVVGTGVFRQGGYSGDGGPATQAQLNFPLGVAVDGAGNLFISDFSNHRIRRVDAVTGVITTVAGTGESGFSGDGGPANQAWLNDPKDVAVDAAGSLYIADSGNRRIRRVDAVTGVITTVAGTGEQGDSGDGGPATQARLHRPGDVVVDANGDLYIVDNNRIRKVTFGTPTVPVEVPADFDGDGTVTLADFFQFADAFGGSDSLYDLDSSGVVDLTDFFLFADHFDGEAAKLMALAHEYVGLPVAVHLAQNRPNPFNSGTLIRFTLPQSGPVTLALYNLAGQGVAILVDGLRPAGRYTVAWAGRDGQGQALASGVYLYRLQAGIQVDTRKLLLLR